MQFGLSHLFFADDLVLLCKIELEQARIIKGILTHSVISQGIKSIMKSLKFISQP